MTLYTVLSCLVIYFTDADAVSRAFNLGLAAILGKGVYNFGELVSTIIAVNVYFAICMEWNLSIPFTCKIFRYVDYIDVNVDFFQLGHPILESLNGTDKKWLVDLLFSFNSGNITRFLELRSQWEQQVRHTAIAFCKRLSEKDQFHNTCVYSYVQYE